MTEWALPVEQQIVHQSLVHELETDPRWNDLKVFMRGGFWRNFKVKYPESNEMYARMMYVSRLLQRAEQDQCPADVVRRARQWLYQGQCNCSYWHGAFGGVYLPHLRNAVYQNLIAAENALEVWRRGDEAWVEATADDYNFDGLQEVRLANDQLALWVNPQAGGQLYELDVRKNGHNLLATMQRRPEAYHQKITAGHQEDAHGAASIHDRVVLKRDDLAEFLQYDPRMPKSLVDHFWPIDVALEDVCGGTAMDQGDFADGKYQTTIRRNPTRIQLLMTRSGSVNGQIVKITKGLTLNAGSDQIEIAYLLEGLNADTPIQFGCEFNFAGLPDGQDDRYFSVGEQQHRMGQLGSRLNLLGEDRMQLHDHWLGLEVGFVFEGPTDVWTYPIAAVSQSESGFELVHQSVVVQPHWKVEPDAEGRWSTRMSLTLTCQKSTTPELGKQAVLTAF
jgi:alpha-amylase